MIEAENWIKWDAAKRKDGRERGKDWVTLNENIWAQIMMMMRRGWDDEDAARVSNSHKTHSSLTTLGREEARRTRLLRVTSLSLPRVFASLQLLLCLSIEKERLSKRDLPENLESMHLLLYLRSLSSSLHHPAWMMDCNASMLSVGSQLTQQNHILVRLLFDFVWVFLFSFIP